MTHPTKLAEAYDYCLKLAHSHYENFPVASFLLPRHLRKAVGALYAFARTADDIADEGDAPADERLRRLDEYQQQLLLIEQTAYQGDAAIFIALNDVIHRYNLPIYLLQDLLSAFRQDVIQKRYQDDDAVLDYCRCSANPIGRLLLHLNDKPTEAELKLSDAVCTALQLINFYQDIQQDLHERDRLYLPLDDFTALNLTEKSLFDVNSANLASIIRKKYKLAENLFREGLSLGQTLRGRLGWEVRIVTLMGIVILKKLSSQSDQALYTRPYLSKYHFSKYAILALFPSIYHYFSQKYLNSISVLNVTNNLI